MMRDVLSSVEIFRMMNRFLLRNLRVDVLRELLLRVSYTRYESYSSEIFGLLISNDMVVLDIGAGWGHYSRIASRALGKKGVVYAFEPDPYNFQILVNNTKNLVNVKALPLAVANETGRKTFFMSNHFGDQGLYANVTGRKTTVTTIRLDDYLSNLAQVDVVKMDIDGGELEALKGMKRLIARSPYIVILTEFMPTHLIRSGFRPEDFINELRVSGFKLYAIDERFRVIREVGTEGLLRVKVANLICARNPFLPMSFVGMRSSKPREQRPN
jgi:FkbM family methyltransferase